MIDLIKKVMFTGIGMASLTKDKIEELGKEIIKQGKLSEKEGKELLEGLLKKSEEAKKEVKEQVEKLVSDSMKRMNFATREDLMKLEEEVKKLSQAMQDAELKK